MDILLDEEIISKLECIADEQSKSPEDIVSEIIEEFVEEAFDKNNYCEVYDEYNNL